MRAVTAQRFARWLLVLTAVIATPFAIRAILRARANFECERALRQMHAALKLYTQNPINRDRYPAMSRDPGQLTFEASFISTFDPMIESDLWRDDNRFWYLGWIIPNERSGLEWIEQYRVHAPNVAAIPAQNGVWPELEDDLAARQRDLEATWLKTHPDGKPHPRVKDMEPVAHPSWEERRFYCPFREGMERFLITEIGNPDASSQKQSVLPIILERPELHGDGGHVLYMDGHVEFVPYPGKFPMTPAFIEGLRSLDAMERETQ